LYLGGGELSDVFSPTDELQKTIIEIGTSGAAGYESIPMATIIEEQPSRVVSARRQFKSRKHQLDSIIATTDHHHPAHVCDGLPTPPVVLTDDERSSSSDHHRRHRLDTGDKDLSKQMAILDIADGGQRRVNKYLQQ
jgi:hypothetical protein